VNTTIVILAAGLGTRMKSKRAKVLHRAGGLALVEHVVEAARVLTSPERIVVVTGHQAEQVEALLKPYGVSFAQQHEQKGTGHALACAREHAGNHDGLLMVLYGDTPLLSAPALKRLRDTQESFGAAATLITTSLDDPSGYGRVMLNERDEVAAIVEHKDCTPEQRQVRLINSGIYCFRADLLWKHLPEVRPNPGTGEYYLTDMPGIFARHGYVVRPLHVDDPSELLGINTRAELAEADEILRRRKCHELMIAGVTIERPDTVTIDAQVTVAPDTVIEPFARLLGHTQIGEDCRIGAGAILENSVLADGVTIGPYTVIVDSRVEKGASVGPFARVRMGAQVGQDARIGNFVELKNTRMGAGAKSQHLAYLGDSTVGDKANIGAGTITCNYDGENKHPTQIGKQAFIGSNSTLVAPVKIGDDSYVGAGSVVTEDVPPEALALGRERQVNKAGWVAKRRAAKKSAQESHSTSTG
jgi:bifunctional UDP-N-acetylglucosamine pyrophosphorylase / glucosamine-1-phosphate N-acetyltransferase